MIEMEEVERIEREKKKKIIIEGGKEYQSIWEWKSLREIEDEVGDCIMVDMENIEGIVDGGKNKQKVKNENV